VLVVVVVQPTLLLLALVVLVAAVLVEHIMVLPQPQEPQTRVAVVVVHRLTGRRLAVLAVVVLLSSVT
jgi:hypothetical protein